MGAIDEALYKERNKYVDDKLETHERRLNSHSGEIDELKQYRSRTEEKIENLCDQIKALVSTMNRFIILLITSLIGMAGTLAGFVIWYIQQLN